MDDAKAHVRLEVRVVGGDHHILDAHNDHESKGINATVAWTWSPDVGDATDHDRTVEIDAGGQKQVTLHFGSGEIRNEKVTAAVYL